MSERISKANDFRLALHSRLMNHDLAAQETGGPQEGDKWYDMHACFVNRRIYLWFDYLSQLDPFSFHGVAFHD